MLDTRVEEIMTRDVISIGRKLKVDVALETMRANGIRRLPIVSESGRIVGIITLAEAQAAMPEGRTMLGDEPHLERIPQVEDVMTNHVYTVSPHATLREAARLMVDHKIAALPVLDGDELVGIVTESDVFKHVASAEV